MKKILLFALMAFALASCGDKSSSMTPATSSTTETQNTAASVAATESTPTENSPANEQQNIKIQTDQTVEYTPEKFDNAIVPVDWSKGLENRRWGIAGRQYKFEKVGNGKYMEAKLVEVEQDSPTEEYLNLSQLVEVRRDESIGGWRGRYQIFETKGRYVCTMTPTREGLLISVNTPQGERAATWQLLEER